MAVPVVSKGNMKEIESFLRDGLREDLVDIGRGALTNDTNSIEMSNLSGKVLIW